jgi:DNA-binding NtrC family response regulator
VVVRAIDSSLHMDYTAVGQTTYLAARMEQLAQPGLVLTTGETLRLAEEFIQVNALGPVAVKGLAEPVEVVELIGASTTRTHLQALAARGLTPFVGRQAELAALREAMAQAGAGRGQVVAVIGESGVGKTRLFHFSCTPPSSWYTRGVSSHARQRMGAGVCAAGPAHGAAERTGAWAS